MVEPVNLQHTLARSSIAEDAQQSIKEQIVADKQAFSEEMDRVEKMKEMQVQELATTEPQPKIREEEKRKQRQEARKGGTKQEARSKTKSAESEPTPGGPDDRERHRIDLKA